jgi:hypothetical protein
MIRFSPFNVSIVGALCDYPGAKTPADSRRTTQLHLQSDQPADKAARSTN